MRSFRLITPLSIISSVALGYAPLGSEPVHKCDIDAFQCPSHYICVAQSRHQNHGKCKCDRFYGFFGPTCERRSVASTLLIIIGVVCIALISNSLLLNLIFVQKLYNADCLKQNALSRTLFLNILLILPSYGLAIGYLVGVSLVDKQMIFQEYIRYPMYTFWIVSFVLSTMSISLAWIETVEKTGRRSLSQTKWKYKYLIYATCLFALLISVVSFVGRFDIPGVCEGIVVSFSYMQASHMVTEALSVMEENGDIIVYHGASDILQTIKRTTRIMILYTLLLSLSFLIMAFTMPLPSPKYSDQNHLPRYAQGQLCFLMVKLYINK
jgi:hypothetical protein